MRDLRGEAQEDAKVHKSNGKHLCGRKLSTKVKEE